MSNNFGYIKGPTVHAAQFTSTSWDTATEKARVLTRLTAWIRRGMPSDEFLRANKPLYHALYQHIGSHIAHYDRHGFWNVWFSTPQKQYEFLVYHTKVNYPMSSPSHTWVDVERELARWIKESGILQAYEKQAREWVEAESVSSVRVLMGNISPEVKEGLLQELMSPN